MKKTLNFAIPDLGLALGVLLNSKYLTLSSAKSSITLLVTCAVENNNMGDCLMNLPWIKFCFQAQNWKISD